MLYFFIQEMAIRKGLNYSQLQEKVDIDPARLKRYWFNKTEDISLSDLRKIAQALGVQADSLLIERDAPPPPRNASGKAIFDVLKHGDSGQLIYQSQGEPVTAAVIGIGFKDWRNFIRIRTNDGAEQLIEPASVMSITVRHSFTGEVASYNFYEEYEADNQKSEEEKA